METMEETSSDSAAHQNLWSPGQISCCGVSGLPGFGASGFEMYGVLGVAPEQDECAEGASSVSYGRLYPRCIDGGWISYITDFFLQPRCLNHLHVGKVALKNIKTIRTPNPAANFNRIVKTHFLSACLNI